MVAIVERHRADRTGVHESSACRRGQASPCS
jgi:hypothetical protein